MCNENETPAGDEAVRGISDQDGARAVQAQASAQSGGDQVGESADSNAICLATDGRLLLKVYDFSEVVNLEKRGKTHQDTDIRRRNSALVSELARKGVRREVVQPPDGALNRLRQSHPHFARVIDLYERRLVLALRTAGIAPLPPVLLVGGPGWGKTDFAATFAETLGAPIVRVSFDGEITNAALLGSDKKWGNSAPGLLFEQLCLGDAANPVLLLEELDKAWFTRGEDARAILHTLLEPATAKCVRDVCLDFVFDTRLVTYIATANDLTRIPAPLRSRFQVFRVERPSAADAIQIAASVIERTLLEYAPPGFQAPPRSIAVAIAHCTAREMRDAVTDALAQAVHAGREHLEVHDLPRHIFDEHQDADRRPLN